jgi:hypothetical protein
MLTVSSQIALYELHETPSLLELVAQEQTERSVNQLLPHSGVEVCLFSLMRDPHIYLQLFFALRACCVLMQNLQKLLACAQLLIQKKATLKYLEGVEAWEW